MNNLSDERIEFLRSISIAEGMGESAEVMRVFDQAKRANALRAALAKPVTIPLQVRIALNVLLNHEPGWENCVGIIQNWLSTTSPTIAAHRE